MCLFGMDPLADDGGSDWSVPPRRHRTCLKTEVTPARKAAHASSMLTPSAAAGCGAGGCCIVIKIDGAPRG